MEFSAKDIAGLLNGYVEGDSEVKVNDISRIEEGKKGTLSFLANPKYTNYLYTTESSIVLINKDFVLEQEVNSTLIRVEDAYESFSKLLEVYAQAMGDKKGKENPHFVGDNFKEGKDNYLGAFSYIGNNVTIGNNVKIYPQVYIGDNVKIGDNTTIFSGAKVLFSCVLGSNITLHSNVIIGGDGFGFAPNTNSDYTKVPQIGNVVIEDFVEIGANTTVDRATIGSTIIRRGVKLDNLIQIAHNVEIGENTVIAAQSGVAGSSKVGKNCMIGGKVGIIGHVKIGDNVKMAAGTGVSGDIKDNEVVMGAPAMDISDFKKSYIYFKNLPSIVKRLKVLEKK